MAILIESSIQFVSCDSPHTTRFHHPHLTAEVPNRLRPGTLRSIELATVAVARLEHAAAFVGAVDVRNMTAFESVWRGLLSVVATHPTAPPRASSGAAASPRGEYALPLRIPVILDAHSVRS